MVCLSVLTYFIVLEPKRTCLLSTTDYCILTRVFYIKFSDFTNFIAFKPIQFKWSQEKKQKQQIILILSRVHGKPLASLPTDT